MALFYVANLGRVAPCNQFELQILIGKLLVIIGVIEQSFDEQCGDGTSFAASLKECDQKLVHFHCAICLYTMQFAL